jgi:hypothetical protein
MGYRATPSSHCLETVRSLVRKRLHVAASYLFARGLPHFDRMHLHSARPWLELRADRSAAATYVYFLGIVHASAYRCGCSRSCSNVLATARADSMAFRVPVKPLMLAQYIRKLPILHVFSSSARAAEHGRRYDPEVRPQA